MAENERKQNTMAALMDGSWEGLKLAAGIATLGFVALIDYALIRLTAPLSDALAGPVDLRRILGWLFTPLAWLLGLAGSDLATLMTGALAGFYYYGQTGLLGI